MKVTFVRSPIYGETTEVTVDMDALPQVGQTVYWDGRGHSAVEVGLWLNDDEDPEISPVVRVRLDSQAPVRDEND